MRRRSFLVPLAALLTSLMACEEARPPYRLFATVEPPCAAGPLALGAANREETERASTPLADRQRCYLQDHVLPEAAPAETIVLVGDEMGAAVSEWEGLAQAAGQTLSEPGRYALAFVELDDAGADWVPGQLDALRAHLDAQDRAGRQNVVVTYVHGWRHDAALGNGDVRKLRRMLAYTRAALNARCIAQARYCEATLTGVFIGWKGRRVIEPGGGGDEDQGFTFGFLGNATSFWRRWDVSRYLGDGIGRRRGQPDLRPAPLARVLDGIEAELRLAQGNPGADKLLIFGHSMGGNMLAEMLRRPARRAIDRHPRGGVMPPLRGDLVVLLNPAARADAWAGLQLAERRRAGFAVEDNEIWCDPTGTDADYACRPGSRLAAWQRLYPVGQRPVYLSLTVAGDWAFSPGRERPVVADSATREVFPFARQWAGESEPLHVTALGHLVPPYVDGGRGLDGQAIGASHEVAILQGVLTEGGRRYPSTYANATRPAAAWCAPADGWLRAAREDALADDNPVSWDYGLVATPEEGQPRYLRNIGGRLHHASVQWRHAVYLPRTGHAFSVAPANSPFWNVRALDTAMRGHAGWAKFPIWCALNQLVLDDVTAPREVPVVEDVLTAAGIDPDGG